MVEVTADTADELEQIAEDNDVELEAVQESFREKYDEVEERAGDSVNDEKLEQLALRVTRTSQLTDYTVETDGVEMLTVGGSIQEWSNGDTFVGKALVDLQPNQDQGRNFISTVIIDGDDVNLSEVQDAFSEVGNIVSGEFSVSEAHSDQFRVLNSSEDTEIDVTQPDDRAPMIGEIRDAVPETDIANITENMSQTERTDDGELRAASFGVDIRRMEVDIFDGYKNPSGGSGAYTVRDESVFDESDIVESAVYDQESANENATPGMTCWTDPSMMEYGSGSVVELFGSVSMGRDGVAQMNVDGIVEIVKNGDYDGYVDDSEETPEREQTSSNVDRTSIQVIKMVLIKDNPDSVEECSGSSLEDAIENMREEMERERRGRFSIDHSKRRISTGPPDESHIEPFGSSDIQVEVDVDAEEIIEELEEGKDEDISFLEEETLFVVQND